MLFRGRAVVRNVYTCDKINNMNIFGFFGKIRPSDRLWEFAGVNYDERTFVINGINVFSHHWKNIREEIAEVYDPLYGQKHTFSVYTITEGERTIKFAAGEFSNGVWGFYVPA